ncbi:MAG TPA: tetratricopeptide repeat protein [Desulfuromonadales bacterium]|nr:tetratricopeptide repeat protein [Desulfuromonadales bacterium]
MANLLENHKYDLIFGLSICIITFLVYANSLGNGFVWDDDIVILANPLLKGSPVTLFSEIDRGHATGVTPYYRPFTLLSFLLDGKFHGFDALYVRLVNVLLHAATAFLVYRLAVSLKIDRIAAILAGLLFAVHPLQSEAVDFNSARNTLLATFFVVAAYLVHQWSHTHKSFAGSLAGASLFLSGLFSKEIAVGILPFIAAIELENTQSENRNSLQKGFVRLLPYLAGLAFYLILRNNALSRAGASLDIFPGLMGRQLDNVYILPRYLLNVVWPRFLSPRYFLPDDFNLYALPLVLAWVCIVGMFWWFVTGGRSRVTLFGLAWLIAFWLPVSGIIPIPSAHLADRYLYTPAIGIWLIVADQFSMLILCRAQLRRWGIIAAAVIVVALAVVTVKRNQIWKNDITLFTDIVEMYPDQALGYDSLGCAYLDTEHDIDRAEKLFERAYTLNPAFPRLSTQMGYVRFLRGDLQGALEHYNQAIYRNSLDAEALLNRGVVLERLGRYSDAVDSYRRFLTTPGNELPEARRVMPAKIVELSRKS